jgi:acid stress-induced BolA-like protein IbaG/YrbA
MKLALSLIALAVALPVCAQRFSFSQEEEKARQQEQQKAYEREDRIAYDLSEPCRADLKNKKIMVMIGERRSNGIVEAHQENYGPHYDAINKRLKALGLRTYTPQEIRRQIAQAEIDAYFRNDPDAALSASRRLGASFILRGLISSQATPNPIMAVNQVTVDMGFTLTASNGRLISDTEASSASYSGNDVQRMALALVNEKADEVVARLYSDYCRNAGRK